jgi:hypothetical protein
MEGIDFLKSLSVEDDTSKETKKVDRNEVIAKTIQLAKE